MHLLCPGIIFQQAFPQQPWQGSGPPARWHLAGGQRLIKGNLFCWKKHWSSYLQAAILPMCLFPMQSVNNNHCGKSLKRITFSCIGHVHRCFTYVCKNTHSQKCSFLELFAPNLLSGINSVPFYNSSTAKARYRLLTWICLKWRPSPGAITHKRNLRQ